MPSARGIALPLSRSALYCRAISRRLTYAYHTIILSAKIYKNAYGDPTGGIFPGALERRATFVYKNLQKYICVRVRVRYGEVRLPHTMRQPKTARPPKKSGIFELFSYRVSDPFSTLFSSLPDPVRSESDTV